MLTEFIYKLNSTFHTNHKLFIYILLLFLYSCSDKDNNQIENTIKIGDNESLVTFNMSPMTQSQMANTHVYVFNGEYSDRGKFVYQVPGISTTPTGISMVMRAGKWDMVLINADQSTLGQLKQPNRAAGNTMSNSPMWETKAVAGILPSAPEIMTARIEEQTIVADQNANAVASMTRNVAMVKVVINDAGGLSDGYDNHIVSLGNVPTTLSWAGGLLPNKNTPAVSASSMRGELRVSTNPLNPSSQISDTLTFIVPAHQGTDFLSSNPTDTTTNKLKLSVDFGVPGGGRYQKSNVTVPFTPKANKIMVINLLVKAQLSVECQLFDWVDKTVNADISQTSLQVSKTNVGLSWKDTVYVKTNAANFTVQNGDTWITTQKIDAERVVITANTTTYTANRSSYINIIAGNITKRINVTQRPDKGTISAPASFWVSPTSGNTNRTIAVKSSGPWIMTTPNPSTVTANVASGAAGNTNIIFTRKQHSGVVPDYSLYYGNSIFTIKNTQTLETITIMAQNLFLESDDLDVPNATGVNTKENVGKVTCLGGPIGTYSVVTKPLWLTGATVNPSRSITLVAPGEPTGERREANITLQHTDDPTYRVTVKVIQDFLITIPPFHYFVIKYTWIENDVDIMVQFEGNGATFDSKPLGYSHSSSVSHTGRTLLEWGGDATGGQGETVFFNAPIIDTDNSLPRFVKLAAYASWYTASRAGSPVRTTIFAYLGGTMSKNGTNFDNVGGTMLYTNSMQQTVRYGWKTYEKLVEIVYDRIKHSAQITYTATENNTPLISTPTRAATNSYMSDEENAANAAEKLKTLELEQ